MNYRIRADDRVVKEFVAANDREARKELETARRQKDLLFDILALEEVYLKTRGVDFVYTEPV